MRYVKVKNLEKYHPGYKDRNLWWAKIHYKMVSGDPDFEMIENETDKWRYVAFILLELHTQKPTPLNENYLMRKGFDFKKRKIDPTIQALSNFIEVVDTECTQSVPNPLLREEKRRVEKSREEGSLFTKSLKDKFEKIWLRYPRREGRTEAFNSFLKTIKSEVDWQSIKTALENYRDHIDKEKTESKYIKHGSTWFNNWQDWVEVPDSKNAYSRR